MHDLVVPDDLDGDLLVPSQAVPGSHHIGEHSLTGVAVHSVSGNNRVNNSNVSK